MLIDNKTGKSVATLQLESRSQVTCVEYVDLSAIPQGKPNAKNQTQAAATAKVVAHAAKSHDVLYIGLNNGTIHIVSLQTFSNIQTFSAKKPSRLHALVCTPFFFFGSRYNDIFFFISVRSVVEPAKAARLVLLCGSVEEPQGQGGP